MFDYGFPPHWSTIKKLIWLHAAKFAGHIATLTGAIVSFLSTKTTPLKAVSVAVEPVQSLNGYDAPWPPGGGKNAMPSGEAETKEMNGITVTSDGHGNYTVSGTSSSAADIFFDLETEFTIPTSDTHSLFFMNDIGVSGVSFYFRNGSTNIDSFGLNTANKSSASYVTIGGKVCNMVRFYISPNTAITGTMHLSPMIVTKDVTGNSFIPYSNICPISGWTGANIVVSPTLDAQDGTTYTVSWQTEAGTVYGGTLDVLTGALTVTMAMVDLGTLDWYYREAFTGFSAPLTPEAKTAFTAICSAYPFVGAYNLTSDKTCGYIYEKQAFVKDYDYTDAATFKTAMSGVQLCYEIAAPITITLTPQTINSLVGENHVWADAGDVTVTFDGEAMT